MAVKEGKELLDRRKGAAAVTDHNPVDFLHPDAFKRIKCEEAAGGGRCWQSVGRASEADFKECPTLEAVSWLHCLATAFVESLQVMPPPQGLAEGDGTMPSSRTLNLGCHYRIKSCQ